MMKGKIDFSLEEFDAPFEEHEFSEEYKKQKELNKKKYLYEPLKTISLMPVLAAVAALLITVPFIVLFVGNGIKTEKQPDTYNEVSITEETVTEVTSVHHAPNFYELNSELVKEYLGDSRSDFSIVREVDGTTITLLSAVRAGETSIVEFTLENENGVDVVDYNPSLEEDQEVWFTDEASFYFYIGDNGRMFVDSSESTNVRLHCYYYVRAAAGIWMKIYDLPCTWGERSAFEVSENFSEVERIDRETTVSSISIPCDNHVEYVEFTNPDGGVLLVSPISMDIDVTTGLDVSRESGVEVYSVVITYNDGDSYIVEDEHHLDQETPNFGYGYYEGDAYNSHLHYIFNQVINTSEISFITVNGVTYSR